MKRLVFAVLGLAVLAPPGLAYAQRALTAKVKLSSTPPANAIYGPGVVAGKARLITDGGGDRTRIVTRVEGLKPGTKHAGHIHLGDCSRLTPGDIIHDLEPLVANEAGRAVSRTVVDDSLAGLKDGEWWVAVHEGPVNTTPQSPAIAVGPVIVQDRADDC